MEGHAKNRPRRQRIQKSLYEVTFFLELIVACFVILLIGYALGKLFFQFFETPSSSFMHFLEITLDIVIGIEFLKMLCRHNMDSVVEVLLFALARHMIIEPTTMFENLLCVAGVALLFVVRKYLFVAKIDKDMDETDIPEGRVAYEHHDPKPPVEFDDTGTGGVA
ncbi:hypothetical protein [Hominifimenecus sp. rT4P-3]|uniref:hypothetical protein n=1 Tax=Hominifimenecus sp. rT4P-3 TaxID=3242979 RepID=UPI003DA46E5E